jgi:hypothetical protein
MNHNSTIVSQTHNDNHAKSPHVDNASELPAPEGCALTFKRASDLINQALR